CLQPLEYYLWFCFAIPKPSTNQGRLVVRRDIHTANTEVGIDGIFNASESFWALWQFRPLYDWPDIDTAILHENILQPRGSEGHDLKGIHSFGVKEVHTDPVDLA